MKLLLACRGSAQEGLGHLFRTRTFARVASARHPIAIACIVPPHLRGYFSEFEGRIHFFDDPAQIADFAEELRPDVTVLDLTSCPTGPLQRIRQSTGCLASLSPVFDPATELDLLFTRSDRSPAIAGVEIHAGLEFAIFSDSCRRIEDDEFNRSIGQVALPVAICMGGGDAANRTRQVLETLVQTSLPCTFWTLLGEGYEHSYADLVAVVRNVPQHEVVLANTSRSMWSIMGNCALSFSAGGLTAVESVYAGLPCITLLPDPERRFLMEPLYELGALLDTGGVGAEGLRTARSQLERLHRERSELLALRSRCAGLIDPHGARRVLDVLEHRAAARGRRP